jgi:hypothetical protein
MKKGLKKHIMRQYLSLLLVLAVLLTAGCVEEYQANSTVTTPQTQATTVSPANTPAPVQTPPPAEMAYISDIRCAVGDRSEAAYHCNGNVRIRSGVYNAVQVIAKYPDNNTYTSGIASMGGMDPVSVPFFLFPDIRYRDQTPSYFVKLDTKMYPVIWRGDTGVAWSNLP